MVEARVLWNCTCGGSWVVEIEKFNDPVDYFLELNHPRIGYHRRFRLSLLTTTTQSVGFLMSMVKRTMEDYPACNFYSADSVSIIKEQRGMVFE